MKRIGWMAAIGVGLWAASNLAQAHVDLSVGIGVPGVPVYAAPAYVPAPPPVVAYPAYGGYYDQGYDDDHDWRHERYERWREHEHERWEHEHRWHDDD
jgi:hypothetical protein